MAIYYCDYKNGLDTNDGATGTPWKTIGKALTTIAASDTVYLRGDAADNATWYRQASAVTCVDAGATMVPDTGHTPVFVGTNEYTSWAPTDGTTNVYETAFVSGTCWRVWNGTTKLASAASVAACDAAENSYYFDDAGNLLHVNIGGAPTSIEVYDHANVFPLSLNASGVTLEGLDFRYHFQAVRLLQGNCTVSNCTFSLWGGFSVAADFGLLSITGDGNTITRCSFADPLHIMQAISLVTGAANATISDCTITGCHHMIVAAAGTGHVVTRCALDGQTNTTHLGISVTGAASCAVRMCTIQNASVCTHSSSTGAIEVTDCFISNPAAPSAINWGAALGGPFTVSRCTFSNCSEDAVIATASGTISDCVAVDCGHSGFWAGTTAGITVNMIRCLVYVTYDIQDSSTGYLYGFVVDPGDMTVNFYHCVVAHLSRSLDARYAFYVQNDGTITFRNCIVLDSATALEVNAAVYSPTIVSDHMCLYGNATNYGNGFAAGIGDLLVEPAFINDSVTGGDYRLRHTSPCINAGVLIAGINEGHRGSAPDIGAFEYVMPLVHRRRR